MSRWLASFVLLAHVLPVSARAALVGHWSLDAGGTIVSDSSKHGNHGSFAAGASSPIGISGALAGGLHFDGVAARVDVPDAPSLDLTGPFSLAAWIRPEVVGTQYLIKKARHGLSDGFELSLSSDGYVFLRVNQSSADNALRLVHTDPEIHLRIRNSLGDSRRELGEKQRVENQVLLSFPNARQPECDVPPGKLPR